MAKCCTLALLGALVVLSLLVSPIACSRKLTKPKTRSAVSHNPAVKAHSSYNGTSPSAAYGSGGWLAGCATYYGAPNGDGSDG
jgi:ABC-type Mn2+/Zn2+ transport system permease subunit